MAYSTKTAEERFSAVVEEFLDNPNVTPPSNGRKFGSAGLKVHDRIFAMLSRGQLVVKLPKARVEALIASGAGQPYDPRRDGRLMKEWVAIAPASEADWLTVAQEAMEFVASAR
ncbi:MAG: TfoX/Sxy family protein [Chloroflexota bacterium]